MWDAVKGKIVDIFICLLGMEKGKYCLIIILILV